MPTRRDREPAHDVVRQVRERILRPCDVEVAHLELEQLPRDAGADDDPEDRNVADRRQIAYPTACEHRGRDQVGEPGEQRGRRGVCEVVVPPDGPVEPVDGPDGVDGQPDAEPDSLDGAEPVPTEPTQDGRYREDGDAVQRQRDHDVARRAGHDNCGEHDLEGSTGDATTGGGRGVHRGPLDRVVEATN